MSMKISKNGPWKFRKFHDIFIIFFVENNSSHIPNLTVAAADDGAGPSGVDQPPWTYLIEDRKHILDLVEPPTQRHHYVVVRHRRRHTCSL